jgi:aminopeptidase N
MKHLFTTFILSLLYLSTFGQYNDTFNWKKRCSHVPNTNQKTLQYIYNWQNDNLNDYDVTFYWLDINVSSASTYVSGNSSITAQVTAVVLDTFAFELIPEMTIDSFFFNNVQYTGYTRDGDNVLYAVNPAVEGQMVTAKVYYHGAPPTGGFFSGVTHGHNGTWNKDVTWTLSESFAAKDWFPVKQDLEDKADSAWIFLTCPSDEMAGSEGVLTNTVNLGNGYTRYEWKTHHAIDYYLLSFAVADYMDYSIYAHPDSLNGDSVLIQNFIYNDAGCLNYWKDGIDESVPIIELYSNLYITYPFYDEKYGHCLTELGGGMEHQTMTTIGGFSFHLVAHEMGHMWFGDNVTCATWQDIWVNEGFATYSDYLANENIYGWDAAQSFIIGAQNNAMSQPGGSVYIPEDQIYPGNEWRIFNGRLSYDKGAAIIHTLRHEIQNDSIFFRCLSQYQTQYSDGTATGEDFKNVVEDVTGKDWDYFFDQWYYGEGYPIYDFEWFYDDSVKEFHLSSTQSTSSSTPLFQMLFDIKLTFDDGTDTLIHFEQTANYNYFVSPQDKKVVNVSVDPDNWTMEKVNSLILDINKNEVSESYFTMGPNPAFDHINLYFPNNAGSKKAIIISDLSGRNILTRYSTQSETTIDISGLAHGTYLVQVTEGNNKLVKRLVK